jgi:hypothetical protein
MENIQNAILTQLVHEIAALDERVTLRALRRRLVVEWGLVGEEFLKELEAGRFVVDIVVGNQKTEDELVNQFLNSKI